MSAHRSALAGALALASAACGPLLVKTGVTRAQGSEVLEFLAMNPHRASLVVTRGDTTLAMVNADRAMPLASTVKALIAVEYAFQAAAETLDPDARVPLAELERFYVPRTDGGAHELWLEDARARGAIGRDGAVPFREVVRGMIRFSSNANAEWVLERVGPERVNARARVLDVRQRTPVYYAFASAQLIMRDPIDTATLRAIPDSVWIARAAAIHDSLAKDGTGRLRRSVNARNLSMARQRVWSDRLPSSTARDYARLARRIAERTHLPPPVQLLVEEALDAGATAPALDALGFKGGSTAWVLTAMTYIIRKDGTRSAYMVMFDDLSRKENRTLQNGLRTWNLLLDTDARFREQVGATARRLSARPTPAEPSADADRRGAPAGGPSSGDIAWALSIGERIRIDLWPAGPRRSLRRGAQPLVGRYAGHAGDTLLVVVSDETPPLRVPGGSVRAVFRDGSPARLRSAVRNAVTGAAFAAVTTPGLVVGRRRDGERVGSAVLTNAAVAAVIGAIDGAVRPDERWRPVPWVPGPSRERTTATPDRP